ncbi:UDP-4-amino-4,6-dideoxy-N-acetyl-beta-L-altrosamine N-acetyltransferase [Nautilia sp. PV-1]|uniref:UDP-4-amino-4, 6-dideoxy-N-acetyl-beta-L-altrosamine N-acetyltransferase n=1 Tax=Nautilia sp. PV-1 TaxID=2579250 RepID=UPI000FDCAE40|nr:UDP-4-amino-4,6-dideoxy-N-acetyl-beta-L-altrosamine N-acetyltransferase [Nautilia sp. PV-1]AZV47273.1 UDP-4-amino-4,6-dideoxy-N-acetyl-beta-L-altrosamine N-acetyltransferase [Nautilia sp. PV-1]
MKYIKFQDLSLEEKKEVLKWRNHPEIRKWMYNKNEISLEEHLKFIDTLENSNKIYLKVDDLGVVNFIIFKDYVDLGIHKNPVKKSVGNILLKFAIDYAFDYLNTKKIILYVFENNEKAISLYKKFGFKETDRKDNLIKMELINADWKN